MRSFIRFIKRLHNITSQLPSIARFFLFFLLLLATQLVVVKSLVVGLVHRFAQIRLQIRYRSATTPRRLSSFFRIQKMCSMYWL